MDDNPLGRGDVIGELEDLPDLCRRFEVARVVVCFSRTHPERTTEMLKSLTGQVGVSIVPRYYELITARSHVEDLSGLPMLDIAPASLSAGARFLKRHLRHRRCPRSVLLAVSPFFLVTAVLIKATSAGPVFFRQVRTGRNEQPVLDDEVPHHVPRRRGSLGTSSSTSTRWTARCSRCATTPG